MGEGRSPHAVSTSLVQTLVGSGIGSGLHHKDGESHHAQQKKQVVLLGAMRSRTPSVVVASWGSTNLHGPGRQPPCVAGVKQSHNFYDVWDAQALIYSCF